MTNTIIIGTQWGDEGKGKIVDLLANNAEIIVRFQGGHNAGHTLVINEKVYKLNLLPSGIVRKGKISIIGGGVVLNPWALLKEIETLKAQGVEISNKNLKIAENCCLILPVHELIDKLREKQKGKNKIGTTCRGIGPAYEDKVARRAIRICDLEEENSLNERLNSFLKYHNHVLKSLNEDTVDRNKAFEDLKKIASKLKEFIVPSWKYISEKSKEGKRILFEGAQGAMLDIDHGTYPFVTSSNTCAAQSSIGSGYGNAKNSYVLGITKAYSTRVGSGPFPTELFCEVGERLAKRGHEFGTVTGRARRCGWFDATLVKQVVKTSGVSGVAITKLDVLDEEKEIKICIGYDINGKKYDYLPANYKLQSLAKPIYETIKGWNSSTYGIRNYKDLPENAILYIKRLEELIETKVDIISTSPEREDSIILNKNL